MDIYTELQHTLAAGWNTWNTRSVLSHVLLPEGFAINLGLKDYWHPAYLKEALIGNERNTGEVVTPGQRTYDGRYTELTIAWQEVQCRIQSATVDDDLVILVTPSLAPGKHAVLIAESGLLWNRPGHLLHDGDALRACLPTRDIRVYATQPGANELFVHTQTPYLALELTGPVGLSSGRRRSLDEITAVIAAAQGACRRQVTASGETGEIYEAMQRCLTWNTIYDSSQHRVISPVSRNWNNHFGGYVIFCWDTFFASYLISLEDRDIAYANAMAMIRERTPAGFVPCWACGTGAKTLDRSNPPVGSFAVREIYRRWRERQFLDAVFENLLAWNRWWVAAREIDGLLCLGSHPYTPRVGHWEEYNGPGALQGALFEAALDNSPMYDGVPFDTATHTMRQADVGLMSLYVFDCDALAEIAGVLGRNTEQEELQARADTYRRRLDWLWDDAAGIYRNRRTDTGAFCPALSPTSFYPLLARAVSADRAQRMLREHLYNPEEFWGEWVLPSVSRNHPAFADQRYWRGKIWPPMNFLVYLGLRYSGLATAARELAERSAALLLREWRTHGHIHENFTATTGWGCDRDDSDRYYHWGGLLGMPALIEAGVVADPAVAL